MIELRHVRKEFPDVTPLTDVNAIIREGDVIAIIGPSGTGKSTLLRALNMLDPPTSGEIIFDGECITDPSCDTNMVRRKMGMVFQNFNLFGHLTVIENIMVPQMDLLGRSFSEAQSKALALLRTVGLSDKALAYPDDLSGGQKQRIAIARTLAMDPEVILFDEPTSALDPTMVGEVETVIRDLTKTGVTMLIVTHEMRFAREIANRVFYMDEGIIYDDGTPDEIFDNPKNDRTRRFIKRLRVQEFEILSRDFDFLSLASQLEEYCHKSQIDYTLSNKVRATFEELCKVIIAPSLPENARMNIVFEYDGVNTVEMDVLYNGEVFNPMKSDNKISVKLVRANTASIKHSEYTERPYTNKVVATIK